MIRRSVLQRARFGMMMGQPFGLLGSQRRKRLLEDGSNPRMQLLPAAPRQRAMCDVLQQGMLEGVFGVWRQATAEDDAGRDECVQGGIELARRKRRDCGDQFVGELAPEGGTDL